MTFSGQTILITAGARGIGRAIATAFHTGGASVHIVDNDAMAVAEFAAEHTAIATSVADVAAPEAAAEVMARHLDRYGGLDILVNCAGIAGPTAHAEAIAFADWRRCLAVNLDATFLFCAQAIPIMKTAGRGNIVNMSSTAGWHGYPLRTPYAAAKSAVIGLTKSLAMELGPHGIRVNAVCPGSVDGERMTRVIAAEAAQKRCRRRLFAPITRKVARYVLSLPPTMSPIWCYASARPPPVASPGRCSMWMATLRPLVV